VGAPLRLLGSGCILGSDLCARRLLLRLLPIDPARGSLRDRGRRLRDCAGRGAEDARLGRRNTTDRAAGRDGHGRDLARAARPERRDEPAASTGDAGTGCPASADRHGCERSVLEPE